MASWNLKKNYLYQLSIFEIYVQAMI